jgi:hypothetical protein
VEGRELCEHTRLLKAKPQGLRRTAALNLRSNRESIEMVYIYMQRSAHMFKEVPFAWTPARY